MENKNTNGPIELDRDPIDLSTTSTEWLEQVIDSGIQRRISGVRVRQIEMALANRIIFIVWVPQSNLAPHMAADHRYYKRLGKTTALMEEYEVRDVSRRLDSPELEMLLNVGSPTDQSQVCVVTAVINRSPEPAFFASLRIMVASELEVMPTEHWDRERDRNLIFQGFERSFSVLHMVWDGNHRSPFLEDEENSLGRFCVKRSFPDSEEFPFGWQIRAPKMSIRFGWFILNTSEPPRLRTP